MLRPHCALQTCNAAFTQSATSEHVASKTRLDPIFCPWLIKYGRKSGFSLSNSVTSLQMATSSLDVCHILILSVAISTQYYTEPSADNKEVNSMSILNCLLISMLFAVQCGSK